MAELEAGLGLARGGGTWPFSSVEGHLDVEDEAGEVGPDAVHQVPEQLERLVLVGDQRLDLGEAAQADPVLQVVHVVEVLLPALVDDLQQQVALDLAHQLLAELLLARVVLGQRLLLEAEQHVLAIDPVRIDGQRARRRA